MVAPCARMYHSSLSWIIIVCLPTPLHGRWLLHLSCLCIFHPNTASGPNQIHGTLLFNESVNETKGLRLFREEVFQEKNKTTYKAMVQGLVVERSEVQ